MVEILAVMSIVFCCLTAIVPKALSRAFINSTAIWKLLIFIMSPDDVVIKKQSSEPSLPSLTTEFTLEPGVPGQMFSYLYCQSDPPRAMGAYTDLVIYAAHMMNALQSSPVVGLVQSGVLGRFFSLIKNR